MPALPRIIFDTSAINHIEDGGQQFEPLMRGLECGFEVILPAMCADEIASTSKVTKREALFSRFDRLLSMAWCIMPSHEIVRRLVAAHVGNAHFDWTNVDVRAPGYEIAIPARDFDDATCTENRAQQFKAQARWERVWKELRPKLDQIFANDPSSRPASYREYAALAASEGGLLWMYARRLYKGLSGKQLTGLEIRSFVEGCAPFRAACYGLVMASFNGSVRPPDGGPKPPGRIDILMAVYLPYCSRFVSDDCPQRRDLAEVAGEAGIDCAVISLEELNRSLSAAV
jgi:hypothetical protein